MKRSNEHGSGGLAGLYAAVLGFALLSGCGRPQQTPVAGTRGTNATPPAAASDAAANVPPQTAADSFAPKTYEDITRIFSLQYPGYWKVRPPKTHVGGYEVVFTPISDETVPVEDLHTAVHVYVDFTPQGNADALLSSEEVFDREKPAYLHANRKYQAVFDGRDTVTFKGVPLNPLVRGRFHGVSRGVPFDEEMIRIPRPRWTILMVCDCEQNPLRKREIRLMQESLTVSDSRCERVLAGEGRGGNETNLTARLRQCAVLIAVKDGAGNRWTGSGFFVHPAGYILSNAHVVRPEDAKGDLEHTIHWDRREGREPLKADYVAHAANERQGLDLGLLHVDGKDWPFLACEPATSVDNDAEVLTAGFPAPESGAEQFDITMTRGRITQLKFDSRHRVATYMTDAQIDKGSSGSPCVDARRGHVVGVNTFLRKGAMVLSAGVQPVERAYECFEALYYPPEGGGDVTMQERYKLACLFWGLGQWEAAERNLEQTCKPDSNNADAWVMHGMVAQACGAHAEAQKRFEKAARIDPRHVPALTQLASAAIVAQPLDYPAALKAVERVMAVSTNDQPAGYILRGLLNQTNRNYEAALADFNKAAELTFDLNTEPTLCLAALYETRNGPGDATRIRALVEKALTIDPLDGEALQRIAKLDEKTPERTMDRFSRLVTKYPNQPVPRWLLAKTRAAQGDADVKAASQDYRRAFKQFLEDDFDIPMACVDDAGRFGLQHDPEFALDVYTMVFALASEEEKPNVKALVGMSQALMHMKGREDLALVFHEIAKKQSALDLWRELWALPGPRVPPSGARLTEESAAYAVAKWGPLLALMVLPQIEWDFDPAETAGLRQVLQSQGVDAEKFWQVALLLKLAANPPQPREVQVRNSFKVDDWFIDVTRYGYVEVVRGRTKTIVPPRYWRAGAFREGAAWVITTERKTGYIDATGREIVPPRYEAEEAIDYSLPTIGSLLKDERTANGGDFHQGRAWVSFKGKVGYVDTEGREIIPPKYDALRSGPVWRQHYGGGSDFKEGRAWVLLNGKVGYIDTNGHEIVPPTYDAYDGWIGQYENPFLDHWGGSDFKEGRAWVLLNGKMGYIDIDGRMIVQPTYDHALPFCEGRAAVKLHGKWGYIEPEGREVVPPRYDSARGFQEGRAMVRLHGRWGFIDAEGNMVVTPRYEDAEAFKEGRAVVKSNGKYGYIDAEGREVVPPRYEGAVFFHEGRAVVKLDGKCGYIDKSGKVVVECQLDEIVDDFRGGAAVVRLKGKTYLIDPNGGVLWKEE